MKTLQKLLPRVLVLLAIAASTVAIRDSSPPSYAVIAPGAYDAVLMQQATLEQQAREAGLIVYGAVSDVTSRKTGSTYSTEVTLQVAGTLRGTASGNFKFTLQGGSVGNAGLAVGGVPNFLEGEKVLLFFDNASNKQLLRLWQGKFTLAGPDALQVESKTRISVATLENRLRTALSRNVDLPNDGPSVSSQPFVTSDPCPPWALSDLPVLFDVNPTSPGTGGPTGTNFARLSYDSWHAWQALTDSFPAFSFGTITSRGQAVDGLNTVGWGNLSSGVLGVNHCAWIGTERYDSDTLIDRDSFTWDADDSNGISASAYSLQAVMEHELGHGLSLGHSDQTCNGSASTPLMCPAVSNGVRKIILADDRNGAASLYDLTGSPPGAPSNLNVTAGDGENTLIWTSSTGTKHAYDIERSSTGCTGSFKSINTVAGNVTTFVDDNYGDGLGTGTWCYRVKAIGTGGDSAWSNTAAPGQLPQITDPPVSYTPGAEEHQISAVSIGSNPAVFVRTSGNQLAFRQRTGSSWSDWTVIAQDVMSRPAAVYAGTTTYVFYRGTSNELRYVQRVGTGSWSSSQNLAGTMAGDPVVQVDGDGDVIVVVSTPSGATYYRRLSGTTWSGWLSLGGTLDKRLTLAQRSGNLYLFGLNGSGITWYRVWSAAGNSWGSWISLGGVLETQLAATTHGSNLYFFGTNASGNTFFKSYNGTAWTAWQALGGIMGPSVDVSSTGSQLVYTAVNSSGKLWNRNFASSWAGWVDLGGAMATGPESVSVGSMAYTFVTNPSGALYYRVWNGSGWGAWTGLGGILAVGD